MDKVKAVIDLLRVLLYFGIGIWCFIYKDNATGSYFITFRIFGIAAFIYGVFRAIRVYQQYKSNSHENL
jgi:hypothetical protein